MVMKRRRVGMPVSASLPMLPMLAVMAVLLCVIARLRHRVATMAGRGRRRGVDRREDGVRRDRREIDHPAPARRGEVLAAEASAKGTSSGAPMPPTASEPRTKLASRASIQFPAPGSFQSDARPMSET